MLPSAVVLMGCLMPFRQPMRSSDSVKGGDLAADTRDDHREINRRLMQVIQHAIQQKGMTRREIEHLAQASSPTVSDWFNKGAVPDAVTIARLCRGLRVNAHWVLTGIGPQALPGEGRSDADQAFALGASAVVSDLRDSVSAIE